MTDIEDVENFRLSSILLDRSNRRKASDKLLPCDLKPGEDVVQTFMRHDWHQPKETCWYFTHN